MEKRDNPVCHFVTPLDGSMDLDIHRPPEVKLEKILSLCGVQTAHNVTEIHSRAIQSLSHELVI